MPSEDFWRWAKTATVLLAMANGGLNLGIFSPTFPAIGTLTHSTTAQMSTTMIWIGLASIIGAVSMGPMFDRFNGLCILAVAVLVQGLAIGLAPWFAVLIGFQLSVAVASVFNTGIMAGCITANCIIWKKKPEMIGPIIQVTDLFHALGTAITPQIIEPFLRTNPNHHPLNNTTINDSSTGNSSDDHETGRGGIEPVQMAYVVIAAFDVFVAVVCFVVFAFDHGQTKAKTYDYAFHRMVRSRSYSLNEDGRTLVAEAVEEDDEGGRASESNSSRKRTGSLMRVLVLQKNFEEDQRQSSNEVDRRPDLQKLLQKRQELQYRKEQQQLRKEEELKRTEPEKAEEVGGGHHGEPIDSSLPVIGCNGRILPLVVIVILFFVVNGGRDAMFTGLLYTFLNAYLHWTPSAGTLMVTFYHVTRVVVHIVFVVLAKWVSPAVLTVANIVFLLISSGLMLATINYSNATVFVVVSIVLTGFATSNLHPTAMTLAQRSFQVDGKAMGMIVGALYLGTCIVSPVCGALLEAGGAVTFPFLLVSLTVGGIVLFGLWLVVARVLKRRDGVKGTAGVGDIMTTEKTPLIGNERP